MHWADGGASNLSNLVSLCGFHHRRLHDGAFSIRVDERDRPSFLRRDGSELSPPTGPPLSGADRRRRWRRLVPRASEVTPATSAARDRGGPLDLDHTVWVMHAASAYRRGGRGGPSLGP